MICYFTCVSNRPISKTRKAFGVIAVISIMLSLILVVYRVLPEYFWDSDPPLAAIFAAPFAFVSVLVYIKITGEKSTAKSMES